MNLRCSVSPVNPFPPSATFPQAAAATTVSDLFRPAPIAAPLACEAIGDCRVLGSLHAALHDASTWMAQLFAVEVFV